MIPRLALLGLLAGVLPAAAATPPPCDHPLDGWWITTHPAADLKAAVEHEGPSPEIRHYAPLHVLAVENIRPDPQFGPDGGVCQADVVTDQGTTTYTYWYERLGFGQTELHAVAKWGGFDPARPNPAKRTAFSPAP